MFFLKKMGGGIDMIRLADGIFFDKEKNVLLVKVPEADDVIYYKRRANNNFVCTGSMRRGKNIKISDDLYDDFIAEKLYIARRKLLELRITA